MNFACTAQTFRPVDNSGVFWLDIYGDYEIVRAYWHAHGLSLSRAMWEQAHRWGYHYAVITIEGEIISCAAVGRFSNDVWAVAAVGTLSGFRRRGHSKAVVSFVTRHILDAGRVAVIETGDDNEAMAATARSVGFQHVPPDQVWWTTPNMADAPDTEDERG